MTSHDRLTDMLVRWQEELDQGRDVPATELCQGQPELLPELQRRLVDLRRFTLLAVEIGQGAEQTNDVAASTESFPRTPHSTVYAPGHGIATGDLTSPPRLPGYEVLEELGHGGMGVVYKARDLTLKRIVALKMLRYGDRSSAEERERFRRESEAIARLHHPHIVQVFQGGEWRAADTSALLPFFAMEYIAGGTPRQGQV
jgi:Protein kinase domain